ncbi:hypothetical protein CPC08DRAFT_663165 [Agrocybe pediades]|nr:hypothetical protein CPC08DRAFT_663165 [Agrocybe pediades]
MFSFQGLLLTTTSLLALGSVANAVQYTVVNSCTGPVDLYIAESFNRTLAAGARSIYNLSSTAGFFYTNANGGVPNSQSNTRAGFTTGENATYYFLVIDKENFNTGMSITPNYAPHNGFCEVARCDDVNCATAWTQLPTRNPGPSADPPIVPFYSCPQTGPDPLSYTITFCPSGSFPTPLAPTALHPNGNTNKCLDVRGAVFANGTPVQIYDCNGSNAQKWLLTRDLTKIQLAGTNFCLDATSASPPNGTGLKIWQCFDNLPAQSWIYSRSDNKIRLNAGANQCVDLTNGVLTNSNQVQTWECGNNNPNQVWTQ